MPSGNPAPPLHADVKALFAAMQSQINCRTIDRDALRDMTDQAEAFMMAAIDPGLGSLGDKLNMAGLNGQPARLVEILAARLGRCVKKSTILEMMYNGSPDTPELKIVDVFVCKARKRLAQSQIPLRIESVWGEGYKLVEIEQ